MIHKLFFSATISKPAKAAAPGSQISWDRAASLIEYKDYICKCFPKEKFIRYTNKLLSDEDFKPFHFIEGVPRMLENSTSNRNGGLSVKIGEQKFVFKKDETREQGKSFITSSNFIK